MATKSKKSTKTAKAVQAAPAPVASAKLTKRNATPSDAVLACTDKAPRLRAAHVQAAWQAVQKAAPASASKLAALPVFSGEFAGALVSGPAFVSYMQRRGYLAVK